MSNINSGRIWKLDTVGLVTPKPVNAVQIKWESPTTDGHQLLIKDGNGDPVWEYTAVAGGTGINYTQDIYGPIKGFNLVRLDSGTVYVYIKGE